MTVGLRLGRLELANRYLLAPMEAVTDAAFRRLCASCGAAFTFTEMVRARGLAEGNRSTFQLIDSHHADVPTGLQLLATSAEELTQALAAVERRAERESWLRHLQAVDLNFGCPSPQVIRSGGGPALLKRRSKLRAIVEALADFRRRTALPIGAIGIKIRLGLNRLEQDQKVYLRVAETAAGAVDYLVVHARHARQESQEPAAWAAIAEVKARVPGLTVIGNGDVFSRADAERMLRETSCDGVMLARAAIRSPWVFRELTGTGAAFPTDSELTAAERAYFDSAQALATRPKYLTWHQEGFARMRARLEGRTTKGAAMPVTEHLR